MSIRAVFDCMVYLQAAANPAGAAMACFLRLEDAHAELCISKDVLAEISEVLLRPELQRKFKRLTPERAGEFLDGIHAKATMIDPIPHFFALPRDAKDEPYLNLAITAQAAFLVTWNARHLTYLMNADTPEGIDFTATYPHLKIIDPVTFLNLLPKPSTNV